MLVSNARVRSWPLPSIALILVLAFVNSPALAPLGGLPFPSSDDSVDACGRTRWTLVVPIGQQSTGRASTVDGHGGRRRLGDGEIGDGLESAQELLHLFVAHVVVVVARHTCAQFR